MTTLAVMAAGILAGRVFPAGQKSNNERLQLLCTLLLIFSMGVSLGQREDFFSELALLGAQALLFFLLPTVCSILLVYALTRRFSAGKQPPHRRPGNRRRPGRCRARPGPDAVFGPGGAGFGRFVRDGACGGAFSGAAGRPQRLGAAPADVFGRDQRGAAPRHLGQGAAVPRPAAGHPAGIVAGSLAGGVLCGLLVGCPPRLASAVAGGLGWYSLAGVPSPTWQAPSWAASPF